MQLDNEFKVVNTIIELSESLVTEITKQSSNESDNSNRYILPTFITFLLLETICEDVVKNIEAAKKSQILNATYLNNSAVYLMNFERTLQKLSKWLLKENKSSVFGFSNDVNELLLQMNNIVLQSRMKQTYSDLDIKLLRYGEASPELPYVYKVVDNINLLQQVLRKNISILKNTYLNLKLIELIKKISVRARMAIAIDCIWYEAQRLKIEDSELKFMVEFFWTFVEQQNLAEWDSRLRAYEGLCEIWDEDDWDDVGNYKISSKVAVIPKHVREMCFYAVDLGGAELYGSIQFYSRHTYKYLLQVLLRFTFSDGEINNLEKLLISPFSENYGLGNPRNRNQFASVTN